MSTKKKKKKKKKANTEKIKEKYIKEANTQTKSKGKKRSQNVNKERKNQRKKKKSQHVGGEVQREGTFGSSFHELPLSSFLSILGRKIFGRSEEKTLRPHNLLFFSPIQSNILQKSFSSHFLFKIFHLPYFTFKRIHPRSLPLLFSLLIFLFCLF